MFTGYAIFSKRHTHTMAHHMARYQQKQTSATELDMSNMLILSMSGKRIISGRLHDRINSMIAFKAKAFRKSLRKNKMRGGEKMEKGKLCANIL